MSLWYGISQVGVDANGSWLRNRDILLCNRVSFILSCLTIIMFLIGLGQFGMLDSVKLTLASAALFLVPIGLNKIGWTNASRFWIACALSVVSLTVSVFDKFDSPHVLEQFQYFHFRLMMLGAGLFPFILFQLSEKKLWIPAVVINLLCIVLYDPIHELFGVGFYQMGFTSPNYYFLNYMVVTISVVLGGSTLFLKSSFELYERKNELLIHNLNKANKVIQHQQEMLAKENVQLSRDLVSKNDQLMETNQELIHHNNELLQFSYTVSHNLRGPVASMLGLLHLVNENEMTGESKQILRHLKNSVVSLDSTIKDLNSIIDIRNKISKLRTPVSLPEELAHILTLLKKEIDDQDIEVIQRLESIDTIYSVKPMITSILYNLISNAIKYRSPDRRSIIIIESFLSGDQIRIDVKDNGMGLDVEKYKEKLFGLYKRFHTHTEGKGIGLFLVKLQTEALGGRVTVVSTLGKGTTFSILLKLTVPTDLQDNLVANGKFDIARK